MVADDVAQTGSRSTPIEDASMRRRVILAGTIGNVLEWYDFIVYGFLSLTIAKLFFPAQSELAALLLTFATFGAGIVMRPVGAVVLGVYADRAGRKAALLVTILTMAVGTALIGFVPTYESIGIWAPLIVVVARLIQGFSAGGELGGATSMLVEYAPSGRRGFYASWQQASQAAAFLLGAVVNGIIAKLVSTASLEAWAWRVPFLFGLLIAPVGLYIRSRVDETEAFILHKREQPSGSPLALTLTVHRRPLLTAMGIAVLYGVSMYILLLYMPTYGVRQLKLTPSDALLASSVAGAVLLALAPVTGGISDRLGRRPLMLTSALLFALCTYPAFVLLSRYQTLWTLVVVQSFFAVLISIYTGPAIAAFGELFPTGVRSTGVALAYNLTITFVGGFAPFIVTWLIAVTASALAPALYVSAAAIVSALVVFGLRDQHRADL